MAKRIGELLVEARVLAPERLAEAVAEQEKTGERLGSILIRRGFVAVEDLEAVLSRQHSVATISLEKYAVAPNVVKLVPQKFMRKNHVVPLEVHERVLTVAMANPHDYRLVDELRFMTGMRVAPVVSSVHSITAKIRELFPSSAGLEEALEVKSQKDLEIITAEAASKETNLEEAVESASEAPVVRMVDAIVLAAVSNGATHVHLTPREDGIDVRLRVNGMLQPLVSPPKEIAQNVVNRIKVLAGIDILQHRVPSGGFFRVRSENQFYDIDVSTFPMTHREQVVLAFQQPFSKEKLRLENLGMVPAMLERYRGILQLSRGLVIVVGPHGSGKTSTLYATLNELKSPGRATVTYENPIKNRLSGINQAEPNERAGVSYVDGVRALLRQDLDHLMIGDATTPEALTAAMDAALGRTLVFTRVIFHHTVGVVPMLVEQGVPLFSMYSALKAVLGQRLVRRLCTSCRELFEPPEPIKAELRQATGLPDPKLHRAVGCAKCDLTGYRGRVGVFELFVPDDPIRDLIVSGAPAERLQDAAWGAGLRSFLEDGLTKAAEGVTTYAEVRGIQ
ncbi:MAG: type II/IV secretion system protein [Deltaproteobacteria bacterium]|nr:type II/IV secretion system protein [Deltaproteobacteria bacterium]